MNKICSFYLEDFEKKNTSKFQSSKVKALVIVTPVGFIAIAYSLTYFLLSDMYVAGILTKLILPLLIGSFAGISRVIIKREHAIPAGNIISLSIIFIEIAVFFISSFSYNLFVFYHNAFYHPSAFLALTVLFSFLIFFIITMPRENAAISDNFTNIVDNLHENFKQLNK